MTLLCLATSTTRTRTEMAKKEWPDNTDAEYGILGLVVNPKLAKLALAVWEGEGYVGLYALNDGWKPLGAGYYGGDDDPATLITGLPRANTPDGVKEKKMGYGTTLYTALCLGAKLQADGELSIQVGGEGEGVCSNHVARSSEAAEWWRAARRRGLTGTFEDEYEESDMDITDYVSDLESCVSGLEAGEGEEGRIDYVNTVRADVTFTRSADTYMYSSAESHNLIAMALPIGFPGEPDRTLFKDAWEHVEGRGGGTLSDSEVAILVAADLRDVNPDAMKLILTAARDADVSEDELDNMFFRWTHGLDPSVPVAQMRLPFTPNSTEEKKARRILEETAYLRDETGWADLADLEM